MLGDLDLWAKLYGVPFRFPALFPANSIKAQRACVFAQQRGGCGKLALALFEAYWVRGQDPASVETVSEAARAAGLEPSEVLAAIETPAVKDGLRASTDEAVARGAFGAPTMFLEGTMLWGNDRLPMLDALLGGSLRP
jgi:2-hydroxychromene-2-carboxylate isomerase